MEGRQVSEMGPRLDHRAVVAAYGATGLAAGFAAVSLYWALGGTAGLLSLGGSLEHLARSRSAGAVLVAWGAVAAKAAGAGLALSLVHPWGARIPQRWRLRASAGVAAVLIAYGGIQVAAEALVELGVLRPSGHVNWTALRWHLALWDPWFLLWGLSLAYATWIIARGAQQSPTRPTDSRSHRRGPSYPTAATPSAAKPTGHWSAEPVSSP
jgi:hypothetical protein